MNTEVQIKLIEASLNGDRDHVRSLLTQGANPNYQDQYGDTALMAASYAGHLEAARLLLRQGVSPHIQNEEGNTALMKAISKSHCEVVKLLLAYGANPNDKNKEGNTPLIWSVNKNHFKISYLLLVNGANPDDKNNDNSRPLIWADAKSMGLLLAYGATPPASPIALVYNFDINSMIQHLQSALEVALNRPILTDTVPAFLKVCTLLLRMPRGIPSATDKQVSTWIKRIKEDVFPKLIKRVLPLELILQIRAASLAKVTRMIAKKYQLKPHDVQTLSALVEDNTSVLNQLCDARATHDWQQPWEPTAAVDTSLSLTLR